MNPGRFAVSSPVKVTMIFAAILLLGFISLRRLPTNLFPDIRVPRVTATIRTTGLSPLEVERRINEPLERELYTIRGVTDVTTIARADSSVVVVEFTWDTPLDFAFLDVKKAVGDLQRNRPDEVESTSVLRYDPNAAPILTAAIEPGPQTGLEDLRLLAERTLKPRFERLEGVANVVISGGREREAQVLLDESLLLLYNIDVQTFVSALERENVNATGGSVSEASREYLLKAVGEFESLQDIEQVVVTRVGDAPILVGDIATVEWSLKDPRDMVVLNGKPAVGMSFYRSAESNTVAVAKAIRGEIENIQSDGEDSQGTLLPPGTSMTTVSDLSLFITGAIREVRNNALLGGVLATIVLLLFLRDTRTTLIIAVSIPVSVIATFNLMFFQGLTLNLMTLGGLALGCGMLVDNAIVVLENIFRLRQEGRDARGAAQEGTRGVAAAIIASTLTTIVVFLPVVYVKGVAGLLFKEQALTVAWSLVASLIVALLLIPMLASRFLVKPPSSLLSSKELQVVPRTLYTRLLSGLLRIRLLVVVAAVGLFFAALALLRNLPQEFLPETEQKALAIRLVMPSGTPIESTERVVDSLVSRIQGLGEESVLSYARIGESEGEVNADTQDPDGSNTADLLFAVRLEDEESTATRSADPELTSGNLISVLKPAVEFLPDARADFQAQQGSVMELLGTSAAPLEIEISGEELETLTAVAAQTQARLISVPGFLNVRTNILEGAPEVRIVPDRRQMSQLGLDVQSIAETLRKRIEGDEAGRIKRDGGDIDIVVEVNYGEESLKTLSEITLKTPTGAIVPLRTIADFEIERGPREVVRRHQERTARVMADLEEGVELSEGIARAREALAPMRLPTGYVLRYTGAEQERAEAYSRLGFALALSILLVYMVMASIFESLLQPFLIMLTIPLAGIGVVGAFLLTDQSVNVMALIGVVMLGGIVVNNAIVLLDCVNQTRTASRLNDRETLLIGCNRRVRPVLMTTMTTLLGILPLALGFGEGAELRRAMAIAVLGGLVSSTILTLFVIPVCQSFLDSVLSAVRGLRSRRELLSTPGVARPAQDSGSAP